MIKVLPRGIWKPLRFSGYKDLRNFYAISSQGWAASYKKDNS